MASAPVPSAQRRKPKPRKVTQAWIIDNLIMPELDRLFGKPKVKITIRKEKK